jgi:hypothetical protein
MELGQETGLRKTSDSFKNTTEEEGFAVGVTEERKETKFCKGGKGDGRDIEADRFRGREKSTKVVPVVDNVDCGEERASGDNGVEESVDGGKSGCVSPHIIPYLNLVSPYGPSDSPLPEPVYLIPLLLNYPLYIDGSFRGTHHRQ